MSEPFLSEIKIVSFNFAPKGWALCNGQFLPINQNQALFSLLGTTYGGNGQTTFALPDLRGRVPIHVGGGHDLGETGGRTAVRRSLQQRCRPTLTTLIGRTTASTRDSARRLRPASSSLGGQVVAAGRQSAPVRSTAIRPASSRSTPRRSAMSAAASRTTT